MTHEITIHLHLRKVLLLHICGMRCTGVGNLGVRVGKGEQEGDVRKSHYRQEEFNTHHYYWM